MPPRSHNKDFGHPTPLCIACLTSSPHNHQTRHGLVYTSRHTLLVTGWLDSRKPAYQVQPSLPLGG